MGWGISPIPYGGMVELADTTDLKSVASNSVGVQVPLPLPDLRERKDDRND